jgi:hypothetical protein
MESYGLHKSRHEHDPCYHEALDWTWSFTTLKAFVGASTLISRDKCQQHAKKLWLQKDKCILENLETYCNINPEEYESA